MACKNAVFYCKARRAEDKARPTTQDIELSGTAFDEPLRISNVFCQFGWLWVLCWRCCIWADLLQSIMYSVSLGDCRCSVEGGVSEQISCKLSCILSAWVIVDALLKVLYLNGSPANHHVFCQFGWLWMLCWRWCIWADLLQIIMCSVSLGDCGCSVEGSVSEQIPCELSCIEFHNVFMDVLEPVYVLEFHRVFVVWMVCWIL